MDAIVAIAKMRMDVEICMFGIVSLEKKEESFLFDLCCKQCRGASVDCLMTRSGVELDGM